jgi:hypothetical protein
VVKLIGAMALSFSSKGVGNVENSRAESVLFGGTLELPGVDDAGNSAMPVLVHCDPRITREEW